MGIADGTLIVTTNPQFKYRFYGNMRFTNGHSNHQQWYFNDNSIYKL